MSRPTPGVGPERVVRALGLLAFLLAQSTPRIPLADITASLGLTVSEIEEDVALLNLVNFGGGTYLLYAYRDCDDLVVESDVGADAMAYPARLSPTLVRSVILALDLVGDVLPLPPGEAGALRTKLASCLDSPSAVPLAAAESLTPASPDVLETLAQAVPGRRVTGIQYFSPSRNELAWREVEPHGLRNIGGAWYLEAYCLRSESHRTFRVDRIKVATLRPTTFTPRVEMTRSPSTEASRAFGPTPHWALLQQPAERAPLLEEQGMPFSRAPDGQLLVHLPYFDREWLLGEVLADLGQSVILEPAEETAALLQAARELLQTYTEA
ncbi:MAG: WYL domain-containing protein [Gaiellales bacterium]|nr:WYL domain-containing protein [Gaiellales bacterium]